MSIRDLSIIVALVSITFGIEKTKFGFYFSSNCSSFSLPPKVLSKPTNEKMIVKGKSTPNSKQTNLPRWAEVHDIYIYISMKKRKYQFAALIRFPVFTRKIKFSSLNHKQV